MKCLSCGFAVAIAIVCGSSLVSQQEKQKQESAETPKITTEKPMDFWMKRKLEFSKDILEALTTGDFTTLEEKAKQMHVVGKFEGFARSTNLKYTAQLHMFEMSTSDLITQAQSKNIQGATLAFNHLTSSCVACHQDLREKK